MFLSYSGLHPSEPAPTRSLINLGRMHECRMLGRWAPVSQCQSHRQSVSQLLGLKDLER